MTATARLTLLAAVVLLLAAAGAILTANPFNGGGRSAPTIQQAVNPTTDGAIARLQAVAAGSPDDPNTYVQLGFAYLQKARETGDPTWYAKSETAFQSALRHAPNGADALIGLSAVSAARHDFETALQFAEQAPQDDPDSLSVLGDALIELGRYDEAFTAYEAVSEIRPDLGAYTRIAYARELTGDIAGAIEAMRMAVDAAGPTGEASAWTRYQLGNLYFNSGDPDGARTEFEHALDALPGYVHAVAGLARVHAAEGEFERAIDLYEEVVSRQPVLEYVIALGEAHQATGDGEAAAEQFELARAIQQLYAANGVATDLELALFEADHGDLEAAVVLARAAYEARPGIHAADALAWALHRAGRSEEAATYVAEALRLGTRDALIHYHRGMIASVLGDTPAARDHLRTALDINPHFSLLHSPVAAETLAGLDSAVSR